MTGAYRALVGRERDHLEHLNVGEDITKMDLRKWDGEAWSWIDLAQARNRRWAVVNAVKNFIFVVPCILTLY
jgi:hypothetical protein